MSVNSQLLAVGRGKSDPHATITGQSRVCALSRSGREPGLTGVSEVLRSPKCDERSCLDALKTVGILVSWMALLEPGTLELRSHPFHTVQSYTAAVALKFHYI